MLILHCTIPVIKVMDIHSLTCSLAKTKYLTEHGTVIYCILLYTLILAHIVKVAFIDTMEVYKSRSRC